MRTVRQVLRYSYRSAAVALAIALAIAATAATIKPGVPEGPISLNRNAVRAFALDVEPGTGVRLVVALEFGQTGVRVFDSGGVPVTTNTRAESNRVVVEFVAAGGDLQVEVVALTNTRFTLGASYIPPPPIANFGLPEAPIQLSRNERRAFTLDPVEGARVRIGTAIDFGELVLHVYDANGKQIASSGDAARSAVEFHAPGGPLRLRVTALTNCRFSLRARSS
jgi:hypothetical protein